MPFKIVSTRRRGRTELCTVPSQWENKGKLRWPKYNGDLFCREEDSVPGPDWISMTCILKRKGFISYEEAEEELNTMLNKSETESDFENQRHSTQNTTKTPNFNTLAECLIDSSIVHEDIEQNAEVDFEVVQEDQLAIEAPSQSAIERIQEQYMQMIEIQKVIMDNQDKIMKKLAEFSVQLEESIINNGEPVITLPQAKGIQAHQIYIKAINTVEDLQQLEKQLSNPEKFESLREKYSILCSPGKGTTCAYRLLDALFTKDFLCQCSWTGGSRKSDIKIGFKGFKNVVKFFFVMVNYWDQNYTMQNNEEFFKTVLRNALKRKSTKNIRSSTQKTRTKKTKKESNPKNDSRIFVTEVDIHNSSSVQTEVDVHNYGSVQIEVDVHKYGPCQTDQEEDEESLC